MEATLSPFRPLSIARWRELALPKEHGSWSLAMEPLSLGLLVAPTPAGAMFAVAVAEAFFARRPLRIAWKDARAERRADARAAVATLAAVAGLAFAGAVALAGTAWLAWLIPSLVAGAIFLSFDLRNAGRDPAAELAGSVAFACMPAVFAALAGEAMPVALALGVVMCGRAVPAVLMVRAVIRSNKNGTHPRRPALACAVAAFGAVVVLARMGFAPSLAAAAMGVLLLRAVVLLVFRAAVRARTLGIMEAALGVGFVLSIALAWRG